MSAERQSIVLTYTPLAGGDAESRWLRVEQEEPEGESLSVAEAAELIDSLYGIEPCDDGMGGGGEEADEENEPDEEQVERALADMVDRAGLCREPEWWEAVIRIYRSHQQPGYELRSETADVESATVETVRASHRQDVEASGAVIELAMPYAGGLTGIPAGVAWEVRGSTVNLDRPLNDRLVLRYDTIYDRVTLRVPNSPSLASLGSPPWGGALSQAPLAEGGRREAPGGSRPELPSASVVVFWAELAASCDLTPPDQDEDADASAIEAICAEKQGGSSGGGGGGDKPRDCWAAITHYDRCNCSKKRVNEWTETVAVSCDEPVEGEVFGAYVYCEEDDDERLLDPDYYYRHCCKAPPRGLPRCRRSYAQFRGGAAISGGAEQYRNIYGADVAMVAVLPKAGICGDEITEWNVPSRNCCDDVPPMEPHPDNPATITAPGMVMLCVTGGGRGPYRWRASAGYTFQNGKNYQPEGGRCERVYAAADACDNASIQVDDGCSRIHLPLTRDNPPATRLAVTPEDATVAPGGFLTLYASNARGEVQWSGGALRLITPQGRREATFEAPDTFCGTTLVTATDACGDMATATVLSTEGHWVEQFGFDPCSPPWGGLAPRATTFANACSMPGVRGDLVVVEGYQGYRAELCLASAQWTSFGYWTGGSCSEVEQRHIKSSCGYTGEQMVQEIVDCNDSSDPMSHITHYGMCCHDLYGQTMPRSMWTAKVIELRRLWTWGCGDE